MNKIFSDYFAHRKNCLTEVDARLKMVFVSAAIIITILSGRIYAPAAVFLLSLFFLLGIRIPPKIILLRLVAPLGIAFVIFLIQILFCGKTEDGLSRAFLIIGKIMGTVSLVIFLSMTTPVNKFINAMRWFKIPNTWIEVALLTYRYIFVLLEDIVIIKDAQKARLGYNGFARSLRSFGELAGSAVIRAYDHSAAAYEAMLLRGYNGIMRDIIWKEKSGIKDVAAVVIFIIIMILLLILNILPSWNKL